MCSRYVCIWSSTSRFNIHYQFMLSFIITVYYGNYLSEWLLGVKVTWYVTCDDRGEYFSLCPTLPLLDVLSITIPPVFPSLWKRRRVFVAIQMRTAPTAIIMCTRLRIWKLSRRPLRNCFSNNDTAFFSFMKFMMVGVVHCDSVFVDTLLRMTRTFRHFLINNFQILLLN